MFKNNSDDLSFCKFVKKNSMTYIKIIQYVYLVAFGLFVFDGVRKLLSDDLGSPLMSFVFAGIALFMFFFRRHFANKFNKPKS